MFSKGNLNREGEINLSRIYIPNPYSKGWRHNLMQENYTYQSIINISTTLGEEIKGKHTTLKSGAR